MLSVTLLVWHITTFFLHTSCVAPSKHLDMAEIQSLASFQVANHELSIEGSCCTLWIHESHETFDPCVLWLGQASLRTFPSKRPHPIKFAQFHPTYLELGGPRVSDDLLNTEEVDWGKPITVTALHTQINQRKKRPNTPMGGLKRRESVRTDVFDIQSDFI